ncbi:hypothetical protein I5L01_02270 [Erythrobacter sp. YJ-T3-07]|nr:hypothetical protein [Erythrobacter sp. YJ-T3-07]
MNPHGDCVPHATPGVQVRPVLWKSWRTPQPLPIAEGNQLPVQELWLLFIWPQMVRR